MAKRLPKNAYTDLDKEIDFEEFRDSVLSYFGSVQAPRRNTNLTYKLIHIFLIILSAMFAVANSINQIVISATTKTQWIKNLIMIDNIPSYGAIWWVLVRIEPEFLRQLIADWFETLPNSLKDQVLAIDGKCLRGTLKGDESNYPLHLVSIFAVESGLILAQQSVEKKSNEITTIPTVLDQLDIRGTIITIDAAECQTTIFKKICAGGADYVLALKGNAGLIHDEVVHYFKEAKKQATNI